jgi:hypothetical protein
MRTDFELWSRIRAAMFMCEQTAKLGNSILKQQKTSVGHKKNQNLSEAIVFDLGEVVYLR